MDSFQILLIIYESHFPGQWQSGSRAGGGLAAARYGRQDCRRSQEWNHVATSFPAFGVKHRSHEHSAFYVGFLQCFECFGIHAPSSMSLF